MDEMYENKKHMIYFSKKIGFASNEDTTTLPSCFIIVDLSRNYEKVIIDKLIAIEELFYRGFDGSVFVVLNDSTTCIDHNQVRSIFDVIHYIKRNEFNYDEYDITFLNLDDSNGISIVDPYKKYVYYDNKSNIVIDDILRDYAVADVMSADDLSNDVTLKKAGD